MRIIAGTKRGMKLFSPETRETRPITDRVKESLFKVLRNYDLLAGARVADLFCGVGSLGLEALSRGAAFVTFVEKNAEIAEVLEKNIAKAGFGERSRVVRASAFRVGAPVGPGGERYDLVFVDPPYATTQEVGEQLFAGRSAANPPGPGGSAGRGRRSDPPRHAGAGRLRAVPRGGQAAVGNDVRRSVAGESG